MLLIALARFNEVITILVTDHISWYTWTSDHISQFLQNLDRHTSSQHKWKRSSDWRTGVKRRKSTWDAPNSASNFTQNRNAKVDGVWCYPQGLEIGMSKETSTRLDRSQQVVMAVVCKTATEKIPRMPVQFICFSDEKVFNVALPVNLKLICKMSVHDICYVEETVACRASFENLFDVLMISDGVGCSEHSRVYQLVLCRSRYKGQWPILWEMS